jgi:hypothetical protein
MYVHHGVELLMKQILVQHSEYLLFDDLGDATLKKQKQANKEQTGVFQLEKPPRTVDVYGRSPSRGGIRQAPRVG